MPEVEALRTGSPSRLPAPLLRPYVHLYQGYQEMAPSVTRRSTVPISRIAFILGFGAPLVTGYQQKPAEPHGAFIAGLTDLTGYYEWSGLSQGIQADLTPLGAYQVFGVSMADVAHQVVEISDLIGRQGSELMERLATTPDWQTRFNLVDAFIAGRLADARSASPAVAWAWRRLRQTNGTIPVGELAGEIGWSGKHLISRFREQIGLPPKTVARIMRFERASDLLLREEALTFSQVAARTGYYDQAHLNRDFVDLAGVAPGEFVRRMSTEFSAGG
jgi:AraC-like DNA-binding protein